MPSPCSRLSLLFVAALAGLGSLASAQVTTDPVGFVTIALPAGSDTFVNPPLKRTPEFVGLATSASGNVISVPNTPANAAPFAASQWVYNSTSQPKHYYVFLASGSKAGSFYTITGNDGNNLTVDLAGDSLAGAVDATTKLQIIPYDTLGTIFPAGQGLTLSPTHGANQRGSEILIPDQQTAGIDLASASVYYYYYSGTDAPGAGWRRSGFSDIVANDTILYPDNYFIVRMKAQASSVTLMGTVQMATLRVPLNNLAANTPQDNSVALPIPASLTLKQTNLFESGAFAGSPSHAASKRGDELLIFDNSVIGIDKAAAKVYYYYTGTADAGPGWRLAGDSATVRDNTDFGITPTTGIVVRKKAKVAAGTDFWTVKPPYVP